MANKGLAPHEEPGPNEMRDPVSRRELKKASIWLGVAVLIWLAWQIRQPLLLILAGVVFASMLDGGARLLGKVLPIGRGWRLAIVTLSAFAFLIWTVSFAGVQLSAQATELQATLQTQFNAIAGWAASQGLDMSGIDYSQLSQQMMGSLGKVTAVFGAAVGVIASAVMAIVLAIFMAIDPRLYERGVAWMLPMREREHFYGTMSRMGYNLRRLMAGRLLGMAVEGIGTWVLLALGGVPLAALLGLLTGLLAFIPNIGAIVSGLLIILVGFSQGTSTGLYAVGVYLVVQLIDGYVIVPMVAKKAVDLAPALVLAAQIVFGALFGFLGLLLADPIVAMIKVALERESERTADGENADRKTRAGGKPSSGRPAPG